MNAKKTFPQWISFTHLPLHNSHTSSQNNPKHFSAEVFHIYVPYIFLFLTTNKRALYLCNLVIQHENDIGLFAQTSVSLMKNDVFVVVFPQILFSMYLLLSFPRCSCFIAAAAAVFVVVTIPITISFSYMQ